MPLLSFLKSKLSTNNISEDDYDLLDKSINRNSSNNISNLSSVNLDSYRENDPIDEDKYNSFTIRINEIGLRKSEINTASPTLILYFDSWEVGRYIYYNDDSKLVGVLLTWAKECEFNFLVDSKRDLTNSAFELRLQDTLTEYIYGRKIIEGRLFLDFIAKDAQGYNLSNLRRSSILIMEENTNDTDNNFWFSLTSTNHDNLPMNSNGSTSSKNSSDDAFNVGFVKSCCAIRPFEGNIADIEEEEVEGKASNNTSQISSVNGSDDINNGDSNAGNTSEEYQLHEWEKEFESKRKPEKVLCDVLSGDNFQYTKHLDPASGKYYYYDHISQMTTWSVPAVDIALHVSPEQKDTINTVEWNRFVKKKIERTKQKEIVATIWKNREDNRDKVKRDQMQRIQNAQLQAWRQALLIAAEEGRHGSCECNMSWQPHRVDPILYSFEKDYGMRLQALRLVGLKLDELPEEIGLQLCALKTLSLANNNLTCLPDTIINLTNLCELNVLNNKLEALPLKIGLMSSLNRLEIANNNLKSLPISFAALTKLDRLILEQNHLTILPENLEFLINCKIVNVNQNKLIRLPKCLSRMPSLTSLSACSNELSYIPREIMLSSSLKVLRLSKNKITMLPDIIGEIKQLQELVMDYNSLSCLPASFYMLTNLKTLRLEGNIPLVAPEQEVIAIGAEAVVQWCRERWLDDEEWRKKLIINAVQDLLRSAADLDFIDFSRFEPFYQFLDDSWFAVQLNYLFNELLPALNVVDRLKYHMPYTPNEIMWAFKNFEDANGPIIRSEEATFRRCSCMDGNGRRKPCVPPRRGYMCSRQCTLLKETIVLKTDRQQRLWRAYKKHGIDEACELAAAEAKKFLSTKEGKLWLTELSYEHAEGVLEDRGADRVVKQRQKKAERKKKDIIRKYETKKRKVAKARDRSIASIKRQIKALQERLKLSNGGFVQEVIEKEIDENTLKLANIPENTRLLELQKECQEKCDAVDSDLLNADSSDDSSQEEESESDGDDISELMEDNKLLREEKKRRVEEANARLRFGIPTTDSTAHGQSTVGMPMESPGKSLLQSIEGRLVEHAGNRVAIAARRDREWERRKAKMRKAFRYASDLLEMRIRRGFMTMIGDFQEAQQAVQHQLREEYIANNIAVARREAERHFFVLGKVRQQWDGLGLELCFNEWVIWVKTKAKRARQDLRYHYRQRLREFESGLACVRIAQLNVDLWKRQTDVYSDKPFWVHTVTGIITWKQPRLEDYVPPGFINPVPPSPLPEGVSIESSSESEGEGEGEGEGNSRPSTANSSVADEEGDTSRRGTETGDNTERGENKSPAASGRHFPPLSYRTNDYDSKEDTSDSDYPSSRPSSSLASSRRRSTAGSPKRLSKASGEGLRRMKAFKKNRARKTGTMRAADSGLNAFLASAQDMLERDDEDTSYAEAVTTNTAEGTTGGSLLNESEVPVNVGAAAAAGGVLGDEPLKPWPARWQRSLSSPFGSIDLTASLPVASSATTRRESRSSPAMSQPVNRNNVVEYEYGPDSLRVGRQLYGGTGVGRFDKPVFEKDIPTDVPSSREEKLQMICKEFVMPALASIEKSTAEAELRSLGLLPLASASPVPTISSPVRKVDMLQREFDEASYRVEHRRRHIQEVRHRTYLKQLTRRPHAMQDKADAAAKEAAEAAEKKKKEEEDVPKVYVPPTTEELLSYAGGNKDMTWKSSEIDFMRRTVLAKKAIEIKHKIDSEAAENNLIASPKKKTFYEKNFSPLFKDTYESSSDEDDAEKADKLTALSSITKGKNAATSSVASGSRKTSHASISSIPKNSKSPAPSTARSKESSGYGGSYSSPNNASRASLPPVSPLHSTAYSPMKTPNYSSIKGTPSRSSTSKP